MKWNNIKYVKVEYLGNDFFDHGSCLRLLYSFKFLDYIFKQKTTVKLDLSKHLHNRNHIVSK